MNTLIHIIVILSLVSIVWQDFKERHVFLGLFVISGISIGTLHYKEAYYQQFFLTTIINLVIICAIVFILFIYSKVMLKKTFKSTFGLGDFLFFIVLSIGFPTATFLVLFSFSLLFSLLLYVMFKKRLMHKTVPLAGLQALFLIIIFMTNWGFNLESLYVI